ncbi:hypothetical protein [Microbacterium marinilacus]|uniref:Uncharacterized protein n=1 Tax=Microbacterium marinilacus TaxID=415209 RepID=A0ABP7BJC3_9MICO|nr:hypothetical protein [Microbacterium marinilacus]
MSVSEPSWVSEDQYRSIQAGLRVVAAWADAEHEPEAALDGALRRESDPGDVVVGLATVSRLLAIELAAATGATEGAILARLGARVDRMQHS